jgi:hypothetical protein
MEKKVYFSRTSKTSLNRNRKKSKIFPYLIKLLFNQTLLNSFNKLYKYT